MATATPHPTDLVPAPLRRPVTVVAAVAALVFVALAVRYAGTSAAGRVDVHIDQVVDPIGAAHRWLVTRTMVFGSPPFVVLAGVTLAVVCLGLRSRRLAVLAIAGPGITGVATTLLKPALGRTLDGGFAFPSGHTGGATSLGLVCALLVISLVSPGRFGGLTLLAVGALAAGGAVGTAMVAGNAHYPTDTVGGFCTAVIVVLGLALLLDRIPSRPAPASA